MGVVADPAPDDHDEQLNFYKLSFEGTRRWRALKLWMTWKHLGTTGFGRLIEANDDLAAYLAMRCAEADDFEALPAVPDLSVVCFRHLPGGRDAALALEPATLDAHQDALQAALEVSGDGWLTTTRLRGATWLRAGIVNYLATEDDIDHLLDTLRQLAVASVRTRLVIVLIAVATDDRPRPGCGVVPLPCDISIAALGPEPTSSPAKRCPMTCSSSPVRATSTLIRHPSSSMNRGPRSSSDSVAMPSSDWRPIPPGTLVSSSRSRSTARSFRSR